MPYLTPAELAAIQVLPHDTPYLIEGVLNGQFSIVRFYGGCKFNGRQYTYDEAHNVLVRDDVAKMLTRIRRKPRTKGPETEEMFP